MVVAMVALAGCGKRKPGAVDLGAARAAVEAYFTAAKAEDCVTLMRMMPTLKTPADCSSYLHEWKEVGNQLDAVLEVTRDGRDPGAAIVLIRLHATKGDREVRVRAQRGPSGFTIVF